NTRVWPMQEQEIDRAQRKTREAVTRRLVQFARGKMRRPDFGDDKDLVASEAGGAQPLPHFAFVVVHLGGIDGTIAKPQCLRDDVGAGAAAQVPGPEPNERNARAMRFDRLVHRGTLVSCGQCPSASLRKTFRNMARRAVSRTVQ